MMNFSFSTVKEIVFGPGKISEIGQITHALGTKVLLVTGLGYLRRTGMLDEVIQRLHDSSLEIITFEEVPPEPSLYVVKSGIDKLKAHECDVVLSIGGGSVIDVGKTIAAVGNAQGTVEEYFRGRNLEQKGLPFIAVPTTAGSGAEVTPNAVLTDTEQAVKASIRSPFMFADVALIDPGLTLTLPPDITAYSGMDALCQAIEAFVSIGANPITDALSKDAAIRLLKNLPLVYRTPDSLHFRSEVAMGSLMGAMAFSNSRLGLVHGMAHPVGVASGLPHGLVCALLLPSVIQYNIPVSEAKYADLARSSGISDMEIGDRDAASALVDSITRMNEDMGIEAKRHDIRIDKKMWPEIISQTLISGSTKSNPRTVTAEDVENILKNL